MQIMDVYEHCVLVHPQVNAIFISFSCCLCAWEQQTPPRCSPTPSQAHPPTGAPFPSSISFSYKCSPPVVDRSLFTLLLVCCWSRQGQDAAHMLLDFCTHKPSSISTSQELPRAGFALLFSPWSSRRRRIPSSRGWDPAVLSPFMPTISSSSVSSAPDISQTMGWNCSSWFCLKDPNGCWNRSLCIVLLIPGCSQGMALPKHGSGFTTSLECLIYPQIRRKSCDLPMLNYPQLITHP